MLWPLQPHSRPVSNPEAQTCLPAWLPCGAWLGCACRPTPAACVQAERCCPRRLLKLTGALRVQPPGVGWRAAGLAAQQWPPPAAHIKAAWPWHLHEKGLGAQCGRSLNGPGVMHCIALHPNRATDLGEGQLRGLDWLRRTWLQGRAIRGRHLHGRSGRLRGSGKGLGRAIGPPCTGSSMR